MISLSIVDYTDSLWREIMSEHSRSTGNSHLEEKRSRLEKWLMQEGWKLGEKHHPNALWVITAILGTGGSLVVIQPRSVVDRVAIQTIVTISEDHQKLIAAMEPKRREDLWWNIRFELLRMNVAFGGLEEAVKLVTVLQNMYDDGLTKDRFLQRVAKVRNAQAMVVWSILRTFDQPPDDDILSSSLVQ